MLDFAKDKKFWENVRLSDDYAQHRQEILDLYKEAFKTEPRPHSAREILENNDHGLWRLQFDQLQTASMLSLIYPDNEEYYSNLLKIVWAYLGEYTWAPLGHYNSYYNRTPKDYDIGLIDIFASSTALALAEIKNLFADRFPQLLKDRISAELRRRTIEPFLTRTYFWEKHPNNWAAVCAGGVGGVLMYECPEIFLQQRERLDSVMQVYLDSYQDDGVCVEGTGYWSFGFGFFVTYALLEKELTGGKVDWFTLPKVKEIATFMQKMFLQRDVIVSFSDCAGVQNYSVWLPHVLRTIYGEAVERLPIKLAIMAKDNTHHNFLLRCILYFRPEYVTNEIEESATYHMKDSAYFVKRTPHYGFATKGGNNGESHNHNDVGSFIFARNNHQILCDLGAGPYKNGYHENARYTFFNPSAFSHNIPFFDGIGQDGVRRDNVYLNVNEDNSVVSMDFTNGYGQDYLKKAERTFTLSDDKIALCDKFILTKESVITERFVSVIEPKIVGNKVIIEDTVLECKEGIIPNISIHEAETHIGEVKFNAYLIDYVLPTGVCEFNLLISTK